MESMTNGSAEDDAASLRAALAVIGDWDCDFGSLLQLDGTTSADDDDSDSDSPRDAATLEVAALKAQVGQLLCVVDHHKRMRMERMALRSEWRRLAASQEHERLLAQVDNAKLRKLTRARRKDADAIVKLTKRVRLLENALPAQPPNIFDQYAGPQIEPESQLRRLDAMADRTEEVYTRGAFAEDACRESLRGMKFRDVSPEENGVGLEYEAVWLLPFDVDRVAEALWVQTTRTTFSQNAVEYTDLYEDSNTLISQFIMTPNSEDTWAVSHGQVAARRLSPNEKDGAIVILSTGQARAYAGSRWVGTGSIDGWLRIERVATKEPTRTGPLSRVKWYRQTLLQPPQVDKMTKSGHSKWANAIVAGPAKSRLERDLEWSLQAIENLLLEPKRVAAQA